MSFLQPKSHNQQRRFRVLAILLGLVMGAVVAMVCLRLYQNHSTARFTGNYSTDGFVAHPYLGFVPKSNKVLSTCKTFRTDTQYCAQYTIDAQGRRALPTPTAATRHLMIFGCSISYGEGVNDDETFSYNLATAMPGHQVYNYAYSGYGPQHMLARWQLGNIEAEVAQPNGVLVYMLHAEHVYRAAGAPYYLRWGSSSPHYALEGDSLVYYADHYAWRPVYTTWQRFLGWSGLGVLFGNESPQYTEADIALTVAILRQSRLEYLSSYPHGKFMVALVPSLGDEELQAELIEKLKAEEMELMDLRTAYPIEPPYIILGDGHPSVVGHRLLGEQMLLHLSKGLDTP